MAGIVPNWNRDGPPIRAGAIHAGRPRQCLFRGSCEFGWVVCATFSLLGKHVHALPHSQIVGTEAGRTTGPKILIVDDDPEVRSIVAEFLEDLGYDVLQARGGAQALDLQGRTSNLRMMITDIRMPDMSGIELVKLATQRQKDLKIILMSGYFVSQQVDRRFLRKPFRMRDLEAAVREELERVTQADQTG
jgi:CheY-like chemotaxis protein